jgi:hypothetical protein
MIKIHLRCCLALGLVFALLVPDQVGIAHTGYPPIAIFTFTSHPDFPMDKFLSGQLGIVLRSYDTRFLYAAYRNLVGTKFTAVEASAMRRSWEPLFNGHYRYSLTKEKTWREKWFSIRLQTTKDAASRERLEKLVYAESYLHRNGHYVFFENCADDAFRNALVTLRGRERLFGTTSPEVKAWLAAQDEVFENCSNFGIATGNRIPDPEANSASKIVRKDRAYQIAAAHFYRGDFENAITSFNAIAQDPISPWRGIAPYLAGRALLRKAQFDAPNGQQFDAATLEAAATAFRSIIADKTRLKWHEPAANLLEFVRIRRNPFEACSQLALKLAKRGSVAGSAQPLTDFLYLLNENRDDSALPARVCSRNEELTDWILTFSDISSASFHHAYLKWKAARSGLWLVAALANASKDSAPSEELLTAAYNVPHTSPAYWTARFYRERLLVEKGRLEIARHELDEDLGHAEGLANPLNPSSTNLLLALRARAASSLDDFLRFAIRTPSTLAYIDEYNTKLTNDDKDPRDEYMRQRYAIPHFDDDAGAVINNYLSLSQLAEVAQSNALPMDVRRDVALMAFTRAIVTENGSLADKIAQTCILAAPDVTDDFNSFLKPSTKQQKDFAAVWIILHHPEMQPALETGMTRATPPKEIDSFQDNWWAHFRFEDVTDNDADYLFYLRWWNRLPDHLKPVFPEGRIPEPTFVTKQDLAAARAEWNKLECLALAGDWLASRTLQFAATQPQDPRVPEALHLAVKATRFGRTDSQTPNYSKQAFQYLHKHFPGSEWTKKTPYWY